MLMLNSFTLIRFVNQYTLTDSISNHIMYESAKIKLTHNPSGLEKGWMEIRLNY